MSVEAGIDNRADRRSSARGRIEQHRLEIFALAGDQDDLFFPITNYKSTLVAQSNCGGEKGGGFGR
jgi:hypothetical protein